MLFYDSIYFSAIWRECPWRAGDEHQVSGEEKRGGPEVILKISQKHMDELAVKMDKLLAENEKFKSAAKQFIHQMESCGIVEYRGAKPPDMKSINNIMTIFKELLNSGDEKVNDNF